MEAVISLVKVCENCYYYYNGLVCDHPKLKTIIGLGVHSRKPTDTCACWTIKPYRKREDGCSVYGCDRERYAKGFCGMHYKRERRKK